MEYRPVRTVRELWRLDMEAFHEGFHHAEMCRCCLDPNLVSRSYYLGWVHGSYDEGRYDASVEALRADMDLNLGHSDWIH